jgi:hypothetical protein
LVGGDGHGRGGACEGDLFDHVENLVETFKINY